MKFKYVVQPTIKPIAKVVIKDKHCRRCMEPESPMPPKNAKKSMALRPYLWLEVKRPCMHHLLEHELYERQELTFQPRIIPKLQSPELKLQSNTKSSMQHHTARIDLGRRGGKVLADEAHDNAEAQTVFKRSKFNR